MKKSVFLAIIAFLFITACGARLYDVESGNDLSHIEVARQLSALDGVRDAAVLSCKKRVLAGIRIFDEADAEVIKIQAKEVLEKSFSKDNTLCLCVGDEDAENVVELSRYMDSKMDRKVLRKRFEFLVKE